MSQQQLDLPGGFSGPYVGVAVFCEKVLREADGVLSLIRVVDRLAFAAPQLGAAPVAHLLFLVVMLKAGHQRGTFTVSVRSIGPSGQQLGTMQTPVLLEGDDRGIGIVLQLAFQPIEEGLHWFDVSVEDQLITRIPLRAVYQKLSITGAE